MNPKMLVIISFGVNFVLVATKLIAGILSRSIALMAEAIHSVFDLLSSLIAFWGIKIGEKPPDAEHPYGP
jgi:divalent metal cation (Fe/Co/Zn/Cd) transporter